MATDNQDSKPQGSENSRKNEFLTTNWEEFITFLFGRIRCRHEVPQDQFAPNLLVVLLPIVAVAAAVLLLFLFLAKPLGEVWLLFLLLGCSVIVCFIVVFQEKLSKWFRKLWDFRVVFFGPGKDSSDSDGACCIPLWCVLCWTVVLLACLALFILTHISVVSSNFSVVLALFAVTILVPVFLSSLPVFFPLFVFFVLKRWDPLCSDLLATFGYFVVTILVAVLLSLSVTCLLRRKFERRKATPPSQTQRNAQGKATGEPEEQKIQLKCPFYEYITAGTRGQQTTSSGSEGTPPDKKDWGTPFWQMVFQVVGAVVTVVLLFLLIPATVRPKAQDVLGHIELLHLIILFLLIWFVYVLYNYIKRSGKGSLWKNVFLTLTTSLFILVFYFTLDFVVGWPSIPPWPGKKDPITTEILVTKFYPLSSKSALSGEFASVDPSRIFYENMLILNKNVQTVQQQKRNLKIPKMQVEPTISFEIRDVDHHLENKAVDALLKTDILHDTTLADVYVTGEFLQTEKEMLIFSRLIFKDTLYTNLLTNLALFTDTLTCLDSFFGDQWIIRHSKDTVFGPILREVELYVIADLKAFEFTNAVSFSSQLSSAPYTCFHYLALLAYMARCQVHETERELECLLNSLKQIAKDTSSVLSSQVNDMLLHLRLIQLYCLKYGLVSLGTEQKDFETQRDFKTIEVILEIIKNKQLGAVYPDFFKDVFGLCLFYNASYRWYYNNRGTSASVYAAEVFCNKLYEQIERGTLRNSTVEDYLDRVAPELEQFKQKEEQSK